MTDRQAKRIALRKVWDWHPMPQMTPHQRSECRMVMPRGNIAELLARSYPPELKARIEEIARLEARFKKALLKQH